MEALRRQNRLGVGEPLLSRSHLEIPVTSQQRAQAQAKADEARKAAEAGGGEAPKAKARPGAKSADAFLAQFDSLFSQTKGKLEKDVLRCVITAATPPSPGALYD